MKNFFRKLLKDTFWNFALKEADIKVIKLSRVCDSRKHAIYPSKMAFILKFNVLRKNYRGNWNL